MLVDIKMKRTGCKRYSYKRNYNIMHAINSAWKYRAECEECFIVFDGGLLEFNTLPYKTKDNLKKVVMMVARKYTV